MNKNHKSHPRTTQFHARLFKRLQRRKQTGHQLCAVSVAPQRATTQPSKPVLPLHHRKPWQNDTARSDNRKNWNRKNRFSPTLRTNHNKNSSAKGNKPSLRSRKLPRVQGQFLHDSPTHYPKIFSKLSKKGLLSSRTSSGTNTSS